MTGELIALDSAALYALSGVAIARCAAGDPERRGDNGAFLSILLTAGFSLALWLAWGGAGALPAMPGASIRAAIGLFVAAGVLSTVLGRLAMFRAIASGGAIRASMLRRLTPVFAALAALPLLAETPLPRDCLGMALVLAATAAAGWSGRARTRGQPGWAVWGIASAAFYGLAYVLRKMALLHLPAPAFGALIGAATGLVWYPLAASFSPVARRSLRHALQPPGPWQMAAAVSMALAQIGQFLALALIDVARVAIIGATETLISIFLAGWIARSEPVPGPRIWAAAALSMLGIVLISL